MNSLFLNALKCQNSERRPPVWLMRQAGRYMPEYQKIRTSHSLLEMFRQPEIAAEVTLLPLKALDVDAAILFSDILVLVEALGLGLDFKKGVGPVIESPLLSEKDVVNLPQPDLKDSLHYVFKTIQLLTPQLHVPLIGFSGAPFTLASYMIEGGSSRDLKKTRQWSYHHPQSFHSLLQKLTALICNYLDLQIEAGVQAIQIFDSWANTLSPQQFLHFCFPYLKEIVSHVKRQDIPIIIFCRGSASFSEDLIALSPDAISLDWSCEIAKFRTKTPSSIALQGNIDPFILYAPLATIKRETHRLLEEMEGDPGFIFNLGHGIAPDMDIDNVKFLVDTVKQWTN